MGDARHQRIDIAADAVEICHLAGDPSGRKLLLWAGEIDEALTEEPGVAIAQHLTEIGNLTHFPQQMNCARVNGHRRDLLVADERL